MNFLFHSSNIINNILNLSEVGFLLLLFYFSVLNILLINLYMQEYFEIAFFSFVICGLFLFFFSEAKDQSGCVTNSSLCKF